MPLSSPTPHGLLALALLLTACGHPADAPGPSGPPPGTPSDTLVLVSLDTLRADHLSLYGYPKRTSPRLDAFAAGATVYIRAQATAPWTLPSHASLFTGLYPFEHGARTYRLPRDGSAARVEDVAPLAEADPTLAEVLAAVGYRTGAVVANEAYLDPRYGLARGFAHYDVAREPCPQVAARALAWLDAQGDAPVFLFVNTMDTHRPYDCAARPGFPDHGGREQAGRNVKQVRRALLEGAQPSPAQLAAVIDQYDAAVANLDAGLGLLLDGLAARGRLEDALVVITSDHGEFLGEHGLIEHSKDVYQQVARVPLVVKLPGQREGRLDAQPISGVHVPGLLLAHAALPERAADPFLRHWPRDIVLTENYYSRRLDLVGAWAGRLDRVRRAVVAGRYKYVHSSDGAHELYDLEADPDERTNLVEARPALAEELAAELSRWRFPEEGPPPRALEAEPRRRDVLRELGYAGGDDDE